MANVCNWRFESFAIADGPHKEYRIYDIVEGKPPTFILIGVIYGTENMKILSKFVQQEREKANTNQD